MDLSLYFLWLESSIYFFLLELLSKFLEVYPSQVMNQYFRDIIDSPSVTDESSIPMLFIIRQGNRQVKEEIRTRALQWFLEDSPLNFDVMIYNESQSFRELATMSRRANIIFGGHGAGNFFVEALKNCLIYTNHILSAM